MGQGDSGYVVEHYSVSPKRVDVVGPASRAARVGAAVTDPIDVSNVVGTSEFRVNAFVNDPYVRLKSAAQVTVTVTMKKK
jgi:YbbR domain-containing protein